MSKILKTASAAAILMTTLATIALTDESEAFAAEGLIAFVVDSQANPVTLETLNAVKLQPILDEALAAENAGSVGEGDQAKMSGDPLMVQSLPADYKSQAEKLALADEEQDSASSLNELVSMIDVPSDLDAEQKCLAGTIYFESKGESLAGQLAVAKVVLARRDSGRFPDSVCGVVYQRSQFSFVRGGSMPPINTSSKAWRRAVAVSKIAMDDQWESPVEGALFFHARHVSPRWRLTRMAAVDNHVFYK